MHIEGRLFEFIAGFFIVTAIVYGVLTDRFATGGIEWAGTTALALTGGVALIVAALLGFVARRLGTRPDEHEDAVISDGAGVLVFCRPDSRCPTQRARSSC